MSLEDLFASTGLIKKEVKPKEEKKEKPKPKPKKERKILSDTKILEELKALRNAIDELRATINSIEKNTIDETTIRNIAKSISAAVTLQIQKKLPDLIANVIQDAIGKVVIDPEEIARRIVDNIKQISLEKTEQITEREDIHDVVIPNKGRVIENTIQRAQTVEEKILVILFFRWSGAQKAEIYKILRRYNYEYAKDEIYETVTKLRANNMLSIRKPNGRYIPNMLDNQVIQILQKYIPEIYIQARIKQYKYELAQGKISP